MRIVALATPGHRPEHVAYLVEDRSRGDAPWMVLTGDSLFVGDLARPDLAVEAREGARELHRSLRQAARRSTTSSRSGPATSAARSAAAPG